MKISIRADITGNDLEKLFSLCDGLGVQDVLLLLGETEDDELYDNEKYRVSERNFKERVNALKKGGLNVPAVQFPLSSPAVFLGEAPDELDGLCESIRIIADAGIRTACIHPWPETTGDKEEDERRWNRFIQVYSRVIKTAEDNGLYVATHGHRIRKYLLNACDEYKRVFKALPSPVSGFTFCMGCLHYIGDDLEKCIEELSDRIFLVHVRDLIKKNVGTEIKEVALGEGEVNIPGAMAALKKAGYDGLLFVEHIPSIPWEGNRDILAHVQAIGYIKALLGKD
ncbi:MAG: sugar phosphate isomerase/epimerase [Spirochaetes bacterium]|nr:sugar phosphate isomerase/epimerase [Spirochaetota bacterium]